MEPVRLSEYEFNYLITHCKKNRENSASLAQVPGQHWAALHKQEVQIMDALIAKLEALQKSPLSEEVDELEM